MSGPCSPTVGYRRPCHSPTSSRESLQCRTLRNCLPESCTFALCSSRLFCFFLKSLSLPPTPHSPHRNNFYKTPVSRPCLASLYRPLRSLSSVIPIPCHQGRCHQTRQTSAWGLSSVSFQLASLSNHPPRTPHRDVFLLSELGAPLLT